MSDKELQTIADNLRRNAKNKGGTLAGIEFLLSLKRLPVWIQDEIMRLIRAKW